MLAGRLFFGYLSKQILRFDQYNPFQGEVSKDLDDYWGVVVVLEDSYVPRKHYYEYAKEVLQLIDVKWEWFRRHIKVTSLYEIERLSFTGKSVVDACRFMITEDPYNYPFVGYPKIATPIQNSEVCSLKMRWTQKLTVFFLRGLQRAVLNTIKWL